MTKIVMRNDSGTKWILSDPSTLDDNENRRWHQLYSFSWHQLWQDWKLHQQTHRRYNFAVSFPSSFKNNKTKLHTTTSENAVTVRLSKVAEFSLLSTTESIFIREDEMLPTPKILFSFLLWNYLSNAFKITDGKRSKRIWK